MWINLHCFPASNMAVIYFFQLFREYLDGEMSKTRSEDVLGEKWDRCLADTSVKILGGRSGALLQKQSVFFSLKDWRSEVFFLCSCLKEKCGPSLLVLARDLEWDIPIVSTN